MVGMTPLHLQQLFLVEPCPEGPFDGRAVAGNDAGRRQRRRPDQPREDAALRLVTRAGLLLDQRLLEVARRDADVLAQCEHFVARQPIADVLLVRLKLRRTQDDALQRLAGDQLPAHANP